MTGRSSSQVAVHDIGGDSLILAAAFFYSVVLSSFFVQQA